MTKNYQIIFPYNTKIKELNLVQIVNEIPNNSSFSKEDYLKVLNFNFQSYLGRFGLVSNKNYIKYNANDIIDLTNDDEIIKFETMRLIPVLFPQVDKRNMVLLPENFIRFSQGLLSDIIPNYIKEKENANKILST